MEELFADIQGRDLEITDTLIVDQHESIGERRREFISEDMLDFFSVNEPDTAGLLSFAIHMLLGIVRGCCPDIYKAAEILENIPGKTAAGVDLSMWKDIHSDNRELFEDMRRQIWQEYPEKGACPDDGEKLSLEGELSRMLENLSIQAGLEREMCGGVMEIVYLILENATASKLLAVTDRQGAITAILTVWKRDHLEEQIRSLLLQTNPPEEIWIYHCGDHMSFDRSLTDRYSCLRYQHNTGDLGYFGRFSMALHVRTPYLVILDDDVIFSGNWLEKAIELSLSERAIVCPAGRVIPRGDYTPELTKGSDHYRLCYIGDSDNASPVNTCHGDTYVDYGCNSWLLRTEWLDHFWAIRPFSMETGEDIHLSAATCLLGGVRTIVPRQVQGALCGNLKKAYGFDALSSWKKRGFIPKRERVLRYWIDEKGWRPMNWR